jgi:hypothetical protein
MVDDVDASIVCMVESKLATVDRFTIMGILGQLMGFWRCRVLALPVASS